MDTLVSVPPRTATRTVPIGAAILAVGCVVLAHFDFFVTTSDGKYVYPADYLYTLDMYPLLAGLGLLLAGICARQGGRGRRRHRRRRPARPRRGLHRLDSGKG
jgi:uncharacterized membrane protein